MREQGRVMLRALALILSPVHPLPAVLSDERLRQRKTAAKLLATFDVPVSQPLPDSFFAESQHGEMPPL